MPKLHVFRTILIAAALFLGAGQTARAQLNCVTNGGVSTPMRAEGLSEVSGDFIITCTGGVSTAAGLPVATVDIRIFLNTAVTSRKLAGSWSEALLLIDEPAAGVQRMCGTSGDAEPIAGVCSITGTGTGAGVYSGASGRPNVFQGFQETANSILWTGVPVDPPGASAPRVLRVTNLRANANALGVAGNNATPVMVFATVTGTPFNVLPISGVATQAVGTVQRSMFTTVNTFTVFQQCTPENAGLAANPNNSGTSRFSLRFSEAFGTAFKKRNTATSAANPAALANQNNLTLGSYNTESGFYNSSFPTLANRGNTGLAGLADQGTRLVARFNNVPPGVLLFAQVAATVSNGAPDVVRMTAADVNGAGPYSPVTGNAFGIAQIPVVNFSATATYEFVESSPVTLATVDIPIYVAYTSNPGINQPALGTATVNSSYGPLSTVVLASASDPVPRFADTSTGENVFTIAPCTCFTLANYTASFPAAGGPGSVTVNAASNCSWTPSTFYDWITFTPGARLGGGTLNFNVAPNLVQISRMGPIDILGQTFTITQAAAESCTASVVPLTQTYGFAGGSGSVTVNTSLPSCAWSPTASDSWITITNPGVRVGSGVVNYSVAPNGGVLRSAGINALGAFFYVTQNGSTTAGLRFIPVTPCRVMDTRLPAGPFGAPSLPAGGTRGVPIPSSGCGIPSGAKAYSLNVTVVPAGPLAFVTLWPDDQLRPFVSTLNSFDGRIKANAAIVPASQFGGINVYATDPTDVIIDINGYFVLPGVNDLAYYAVTPCRIADTRLAPGPFGGPALGQAQTRTFAVLSAGCGIPANAQAYSLNMTALPPGALSFLTTWPSGQAQPLVSTLNALTGAVTANAAIVRAGSGGAINVYVTNPTDLIIDINGYFAPPGVLGELTFRPVIPCRISDTRNPFGVFGGPAMAAGTSRDYPVVSSACGLPSISKAYSLNATVVPGGLLGFLRLWPTGQPQPFVSTLNSFDGTVVSNAAIVPAGTSGSVSAYVTHTTELILDVNGYFAP